MSKSVAEWMNVVVGSQLRMQHPSSRTLAVFACVFGANVYRRLNANSSLTDERWTQKLANIASKKKGTGPKNRIQSGQRREEDKR